MNVALRCVVVSLAIVILATASLAADDEQLKQQITERLWAHKSAGQLEQFDIRLNVHQGAVYLYGYVATVQQKRLALNAARQTSGVRQVFNKLRVRPRVQSLPRPVGQIADAGAPLPPAPTPAALDSLLVAPGIETAQVSGHRARDRLVDSPPQFDPGLPPRRPGPAQDSSRRAAAAGHSADARLIAGRLIERFRQLQAHGDLHDFIIELSVAGGAIRMKGRVSSPAQRQLALQIAEQVAGPGMVIDQLRVLDSNHRATVAAAAFESPLPALASSHFPPLNVTIRLPQTQWE